MPGGSDGPDVLRYLDPDMYSMMEDNSGTIRSTKFQKLTEAICGVVRRLAGLGPV